MILAIDVGGTKTLMAILDHKGHLRHAKKIATSKDYSTFCAELVAALQAEFWRPDITAISIAVPGRIDYMTNEVTAFGNLPWGHVDLMHFLKKEFRVPVLIDNDANLAGLGEAHEFSQVPDNLLYITIGTGIGSGIITEGQINPTFAHSEAGHIMIEQKGHLQRWEDLCSGRALYRDHGKKASEIEDAGIWKDFADKLSLGFLAILPLLQPEVVVVGGGIGTHFKKYAPFLVTRLQETLPPIVQMPKITKAVHSEEAVVYGCYQLAKQARVT